MNASAVSLVIVVASSTTVHPSGFAIPRTWSETRSQFSVVPSMRPAPESRWRRTREGASCFVCASIVAQCSRFETAGSIVVKSTSATCSSQARRCRAKNSNIGGQSTQSAPGAFETSHQCPAPFCSKRRQSRWNVPRNVAISRACSTGTLSSASPWRM